MKMQSIDGDTETTLICAFKQGVRVYQADQYRDRTEIHNDLSSGKLNLILKDVKTSDEGIYKCQAANKKNNDEKMIKLCVKLKPTELINAAEGESVTFQVDFSGPRTEVTWRNGEDKLVAVGHPSSYFYHLADRASVSFHSGSLTIRDLVESDSGYYIGNIISDGKSHATKFILKVSPSKPEVRYNVTNGAITVYCKSNSTGVKYEWRNSSGDLLSTEAVYTAPPETLRINNTVTCIVKNKVSECNSSVTIEHYKPKENTESNGKREIWIRASLRSVVILVSLVSLAVILILFLWSKRHSRPSNPKSQEYPEESLMSTCNDNLLDSPVKPEKPESTCDIDYKCYIEVSESIVNERYIGRE